jgi:hypothetical protein
MTLLFVLSSQRFYAQYIEIGDGLTYGTYPSYYGPWGNYWENCRTQTLYLASELGAPTGKLFTGLAWNFEQIPTGTNYLNNVAIKIKETAVTSLTSGAFADMTDAIQVFYAASLVPATSTGWKYFDITDYIWTGTDNLIIEVVWGDNGYYTSPYYHTYKTDAVSATRMLIGYADSQTPPNYSAASTCYDNMRFYWAPLTLPGNIEGFVFNYDGLSISGATVAVQNGPSTISGADGHYFITGINSGDQTVGCGKTGYNPTSTVINIPAGDTIDYNFTLTQPNMVINPLYIEETLNPGEYLTTSLNILNNGDGPLGWQTTINYLSQPVLPYEYSHAIYASFDTNNNWLTMDSLYGTVPPFGGVTNVPTHMDAAGTYSGEVYSAEVVFTSNPNVATITVPVTMTILGNELIAPENLEVSLVQDVDGKVELTWEWNGDSFQFFMIKRDGVIIATTTSQIYTDILPDYGTYCFTVQAVYNEGFTTPAGPSCIEWPNPVLSIDPDNLEGWVWTGFTKDVYTTITNLGVGTLAYSFPEFAALNLLNDPNIEKNKTGSPVDVRSDIKKGDESYDGAGYPVILGAGGPDDFGYIWIDSDESGGPNYSYTDISTTGSPVYGLSDDNIVGPYSIGFEFSFYGEYKTQFWVNSNGVIGFTSTYITLGNSGIPTNSSIYKDFIAWFWDDMYFRTGTSQVFYQTFSDKTIIQFMNYERFGQAGLYINAEVIIYRNGKILIMYDNIAAGVILNSCTVGIQSPVPELGLQVTYNTTYLHNDLAILFSVPADFIEDVQPAFGTVIQGSSKQVTITYDSDGYNPGDYTQDLLLESNDPENTEFIIANTMHVYTPAQFAGTVTDHDDNIPLPGVIVTAGPFQTITGEDGEYSLFVDEGNYNVVFEKLGYLTVTVADTFSLQGVVTPISIGMWDNNYAPGFVHASVMEDDSWCEVTWTLPDGPYEIVMDDGEADDYFIYALAGSWNAVKFTPSGYPATAIGGQIYVGDGNFPGQFIGTEFGIAIFDDDGINDLPGTMLDSSGVTVNNYGWINFDWLSATIDNGSFYLAIYQAANAPDAAPIGVDLDSPTYFMSYSKFQSNDWSLSPFQDFMIRAWVDGPESDSITDSSGKVWRAVPKVPANWQQYAMTRSGTLPKIIPGFERNDFTYKGVEGMSNRDVTNYRIGRYSNFDPDGSPSAGSLSELANTGNLYYNDNAWTGLPQGWYAYGVKAMYTSGVYSSYTISNIVGHLMDCRVTVNVTLSTGLEPINVEVKLKGSDYPYETFFAVTPANGTVVFDQVWKGHYDISAFKIGYDTYIIENAYIATENEFNIILSEKKYPPTNLKVDPVSLDATWNQPLRIALEQGFQDTQFPPAGWQNLTQGDAGGWERTDDGSSGGWTVPAWDSFYACANDDAAGSNSDGCCDYLITPPLDLRESEGYALTFDSFYNGAFGQLAFIEYSLDQGETWEMLYQAIPDTSWVDLELDLSAFSGQTGPAQIWFAFHADDAGQWASGWAIDNVLIQVPAPAAGYLDFWVFLDDALEGVTVDTSWNYSPLWYGQTYTASVAAHYSSGLSAKDYYTFFCEYLFPPRNLTGSAPDNAAILIWDPPLELWFPEAQANPRALAGGFPDNLLGYNIYRDGVFVDYSAHVGEMEPQRYMEESLDPGIYQYTITAVYDLTPYGYIGESGESTEEGPAEVVVDYCYDLEFMETWTMGNFENNEWLSDGENWKVNGQAGNPDPSAEFSWDPILTNYAVALESYPLCAVGITEGKIWLDFDLALYIVQPTGEEILLAQVWNWQNQTWFTVAEYSNIDGSFDWMSEHIDIRAEAMDKVFKIRFLATGVNSLNIRSWFVDNIHVYRTCIAPTGLTAEPAFGEGILLTWQLSDNSYISAGINPDDALRELTSCNIFRSENEGEYILIGSSSGMTYIDPEDGLVTGPIYCYKVNAVWESPTDQCESDLSNEACAIWTYIVNHPDPSKGSLSIYPNPANDQAFITATEGLKHISVFNATGQLVFDQSMTTMQFALKTSGFSIGIYIVRVETSTGIISTRKLTIQR